MIAIILFVLGISFLVYHQIITSKITYPPAKEYIGLIKDIALLKTSPADTKTQIQTRFMNFIAELGTHSLEKQHSGVGYFRLPDLTPVYVLSNKEAIQQLYAKNNEKKFGQTKFFNRLAILLGQDNLMSSNLGSDTHSKIRKAIFNRNEVYRPKVAQVVANFIQKYELEQTAQGAPLSEVMDRLSRHVLLATYFGETSIEPFEKLYNSELTKELIDCLFSLEPIKQGEQGKLLLLRNQIFTMGCQLIFSSVDITKNLMAEQSWLNYLLVVRILQNPEMKDHLKQLGIDSTERLTAEECELLVHHSQEESDNTPLSKLVRDVINESLFIPLLGFDATATALITALRIVIQDKRIYSIVKQEVQQKVTSGEHFELNSVWKTNHDQGALSYTEAVLLEALRLLPPAPIVPEIINEPISLNINGSLVHLPAGSFVFIPMQSVHTHSMHFSDISLTAEGQKALGKEYISAKDIFPERWGPKPSAGAIYNSSFFNEDLIAHQPGALGKNGGLLTFKTGGRGCPGLRIATTEILSLLRMIATHKFELTGEGDLELRFNYEKPLQRNGGMGLLKIHQRKNKLAESFPTKENSDNAYQGLEIYQKNGLNFFPEAPDSKDINQIENALEIMSLSRKNDSSF